LGRPCPSAQLGFARTRCPRSVTARIFHRRCDRKTIRDGFSVTRELAKADGDRVSSDEGVTTSLSTLCRWGAWELDGGK
jgi:hypothetical protein